MNLKKLIIKSFRGIKDLEFELNERLNVLKGQNGVGKTTIIDSIMWVLCGETMVYGKQDSDNRNKHDLKDTINVILELDNGIKLERKYYDLWKEDNDGNLKYARTENKFLINGANYGKEEFYERLRNDIGLEYNVKTKDFNILRFLIDYSYFGTIDYKVSRKFLEECLKLKSDNELLSEERFKSIANDMFAQKCEIGKVLNQYRNDLKDINKQISLKENFVNANKKNVNEQELAKYQELCNKRDTLFRSNLNENNDLKVVEQQIQELGVNIQESEKSVLNAINEANANINKLIQEGNDLQWALNEKQNRIANNNGTINKLENNINVCNVVISDIEKEEFVEVLCPNCQTLINEDEKKEFAQFKTNRISKIKEEIKGYEKQINNLIKENEDLEQAKELNQKTFNDNKVKYQKLNKKLEDLQKQRDDNEEVKTLLVEKEKLEKEREELINKLNIQKSEMLTEINNQIVELLSMSRLNDEINLELHNIKHLKGVRANVEIKQELVKEFKQMKLDMIKENTKRVFPNVDIQIIEINENTDVIKEVCYAKLKGVEFNGMNDGYKYLLGIQIIEDIKKHLGLKDLPIIFDKFADIDKETYKNICKITKSQIFTTLVEETKEITLNG